MNTRGNAIRVRPGQIQPGQLLSRSVLEQLLTQLAPQPGEASSSVYLPPGALAEFLSGRDPDLRYWREQLQVSGNAVQQSDTGVVGLLAGSRGLIILPPYPVKAPQVLTTWNVDPLLSLVTTDYTVGVILLRLGRYLVAVFQGEQVVSSKTDTRYVKGKHHAGGTSQLRFQRIREGQMRKLYDETCGVARTQFSPYARRLDYLRLGGDRFTLNGFLKVCPYLEQFRDITLGRRLNLRNPKHNTLEEVAGLLRQSQVYPVGS